MNSVILGTITRLVSVVRRWFLTVHSLNHSGITELCKDTLSLSCKYYTIMPMLI